MLHKPLVIWFTGLSGAGKSTLAESLSQYLSAREHRVKLFDGDTIRKNRKISGFSKQERIQHNLDIISSVKQERDCDFILVAVICPYQSVMDYCRENIENYFEVYVSTPLEVCEARDTKGLYKRARRGEISNLTGVNDPYEVPQHPNLTIDTSHSSVDNCIESITGLLHQEKYL